MKRTLNNRLSLAVGPRAGGATHPPSLAAAAEKACLGRFLVMEAWRETVVPITAFSLHTQRIGIGTAVMQIYPVNPVIVALQAAELQELSEGRFSLGLGLGARFVVPRWFGVEYDRPLQRMREFLEVIRGIHTSGGRPFSYDGSLFQIRKYSLGEKLLAPVPLHIAAVGPRMQELAGELADGVMVGPLHSDSYLECVRDRLATGAVRTGRDASQVEIFYHLITACNPDNEYARRLARRSIIYCAQHEPYLQRFRAEGFGQEAQRMNEFVREHQEDRAEALVSDAMLERFTVAGTPAECREQLKVHLNRDASPVLMLVPFRITDAEVSASHRYLLDELTSRPL